MEYVGKKSASSFLRTGLNIAWYLGLAATLLLLLIQLYFFIVAPRVPLEGPVMLQFETTGLVFQFTEGIAETISPVLFGLQFTLTLPLLAIGLLIIYQLRKIFASLVNATPFIKENVCRIRIIGWAVIAATLLKTVLGFLVGLSLVNSVAIPGLELLAKIRLEDFAGVLLGAIVLILAEVFRIGAHLQEDQDLTV